MLPDQSYRRRMFLLTSIGGWAIVAMAFGAAFGNVLTAVRALAFLVISGLWTAYMFFLMEPHK